MIKSLEYSQDLHFKNPYLDNYLSNIKQHNKFLLTQIRKFKQRANDLQNQIKLKNSQIMILKQQNSIYQQRYFDIKQVLQEKLKTISQKIIQLVSEEKNNQRIQKQCFQECQTMSFSSKNLINNQQLEQLSDLHNRFNALMYEYKNDFNAQSRKKCIQLIKQMLEKKQSEELSPVVTEEHENPINYCSKIFQRETMINEISINNTARVTKKALNYKFHRYSDSQNLLQTE